MPIEFMLFLVAVFLLLSILASVASDRLGIPSLILFLLIGMLAGSDGVGKIYFDNAKLAQQLGSIALAFIIFAGGLSTSYQDVKPVLKSGLSLSTLGVLLTAVVVGVSVHFIAGISWQQALLLGAIVSSTDAASVFSVLNSRGVRLKGHLKSLLEFESGSNDPMAVFLTVGIITFISAPQTNLADFGMFFLKQLLIGGIGGYIVARLSVLLLNRFVKLNYEGVYSVLTIALALFSFGATASLGGSGFLAIFILGIVMGNSEFQYKRTIQRFHDSLAWLSQIGMFLTLGLLVYPSQLPGIMKSGIVITLVLIFMARPLSVFISLAFTRFSFREKLLISWVGLRGATPIILATFPMLAGVAGAGAIFNYVFFIVIFSVLVQGTTIAPLARWLGLEDRVRKNVKYPIEFEKNDKMEGELNEIEIPPDSTLVGRKIMEIGMPEKALIILIYRNDRFITASGRTVLMAGDRMLVLANMMDFLMLSELVFTSVDQESGTKG